MTTWYANVIFRSLGPIDDDVTFEIMEALGNYGASMGRSADLSEGAVGLTVKAGTLRDAAELAGGLVRDATKLLVGDIEVTGLEVMTLDALETENAKPIFPEVVGYAEIADLAGVTRQRARQFASIEGFPAPVIETAQGPLMTKAAVESWLARRSTKSGRRKKLVTA